MTVRTDSIDLPTPNQLDSFSTLGVDSDQLGFDRGDALSESLSLTVNLYLSFVRSYSLR